MSADALLDFVFWSGNQDIFALNDGDIGVRCYRDKTVSIPGALVDHKEVFYKDRNCMVVTSNKKYDKFKEQFSELQNLLRSNKIIHVEWRSRAYVLVIFDNMALVHFFLQVHSNDLEYLVVDSSLSPKNLLDDQFYSVAVGDGWFCFTYRLSNKLSIVNFDKKYLNFFNSKKFNKVTGHDLKHSSFTLPGGVRCSRSLILNEDRTVLVVFCSKGQVDAGTWQQFGSDANSANMLLYDVSLAPNLLEIGGIQTEGDPLACQFIGKAPVLKLLSIEVMLPESTCKIMVYEAHNTGIHSIFQRDIHFKGSALSSSISPDAKSCVISTSNKELVVADIVNLDRRNGTCPFVPSFIQWHPQSTCFVVASRRGDIQLMDKALNVLSVRLSNESSVNPAPFFKLSAFFKAPIVLTAVRFSTKRELSADEVLHQTSHLSNKILFVCEKGPIGVCSIFSANLSSSGLLSFYIKRKRPKAALKYLYSTDWISEPALAYYCLSTVFDYLIRLPISFENEDLIEECLNFYYKAPYNIPDEVIDLYGDNVRNRSIQYFQRLMRYGKLEKAYRMAVDLRSPALFMDIYYMAVDLKENAFALVARKKAEELAMELNMPCLTAKSAETSHKKLSSSPISWLESEESHEIGVPKVGIPHAGLSSFFHALSSDDRKVAELAGLSHFFKDFVHPSPESTVPIQDEIDGILNSRKPLSKKRTKTINVFHFGPL